MMYQTSKAASLAGLLMSLVACSGGSDQSSSTDQVTADSESSRLPRVTLTSATSTIAGGESTTLGWTSTNVDRCQASGGWSGSRALNGTEATPTLTQSTTFNLACDGPGGSINRSVTVNVQDSQKQPNVTLSADRKQISPGDTVQLTWTSSDADNCSASGSWEGGLPISGNQTVGPLTADSSFTVTCSNLDGSAVTMVAVSITAHLTLRWVAPIENVDGTELTDLGGYRIYYGERTREYSDQEAINDPKTTNVSIAVTPGDYYVAMTAVDAQGNESGYSNEILKTAD